jgi:hypothetical protein
MGKETTFNNNFKNDKIAQLNGNKIKINQNKDNLAESFKNGKPQYKPLNIILINPINYLNRMNYNYINNLNGQLNQNINKNLLNKQNGTRKISIGSETSCSSQECSPKKNITKKTLNKNKVPFKGEAKDFKIKYKTELCKYFEINGYCKYGDKCAYAHGKENLRSKVTNTTAYRSKRCSQFYEQGYCPYGNRCQFAHQLKSNIINNPYDKGMTYGKILETISKMENVENIKKLVEKPRLPIFQEICPNKENTQSRLLEDIKGLKYNNIQRRF